MGGKILFVSGDKSFEIFEEGRGADRWFVWVERGRRFTSQIKIDKENLRWVCTQMQQASRGQWNLYRRWGRKIQTYIYRVYQNFNIYGRYLKVETIVGERRKGIIIPEVYYSGGWGDISRKILHWLGEATSNKFKIISNIREKSFLDTAQISSWPLQQKESPDNLKILDESSSFLSKCLVGYFNDPFNHSPKAEIIQPWFVKRWQVTAGLRVSPISHNNFLFEFPSRQEASRVKAGDWFWNGRHLTLDWWSPESGSASMKRESGHKWIKAFGLPLNGWYMDSFKTIGEVCGGFIGIDEDTRARSHFFGLVYV